LKKNMRSNHFERISCNCLCAEVVASFSEFSGCLLFFLPARMAELVLPPQFRSKRNRPRPVKKHLLHHQGRDCRATLAMTVSKASILNGYLSLREAERRGNLSLLSLLSLFQWSRFVPAALQFAVLLYLFKDTAFIFISKITFVFCLYKICKSLKICVV